MAFKTYLDPCKNRFNHQMGKIIKPLEFVMIEIAQKRKDVELANFFIQNVAVRTVSNIEEYLNNMIFQASIRNMDSIIRYFENSESENERVQIKNINKDRIVNYGNMAKKHVTFKRNGKKLKNIFNHIFGFPLFPDEEIESIILDLVLIRNIILHEGGWPQPYHAELIRNNGVIIVEQKIGVHKFYKLEIVMNLFMKKAIDAIRLTIKYIHNNIENDSRFDVDSDNVYFVLGEYDKAVEDFEKRIKFYECNLGDEHPKAKKARENLEIAKDLAKKNIK